jgi:hypothetical protein
LFISQIIYLSFLVKMGLCPIPLAAYSPDFIPPVTGVGGKPNPVANSFDPTGNFDNRPRAGSTSKKRRYDELDRVFDLTEPYPPLSHPGKPPLDITEIRTLLVAATVAGEEASKTLEDPDLDPKIKIFGNLAMAILGLVSGIVKNGIVPLSGGLPPNTPGAGTGTGSGNRSGSGTGSFRPPPPPPKTITGINDLKESLMKADNESIVFDANLGIVAIGNRNNLAAAFSSGIHAAAIGKAEEKGTDPAEAERAMNDALDCVADMEFIGIKSELQKDRAGFNQNNRKHFTMPIKLCFEDRHSRLHFEKTIKNQCGLRAVMSLPKPLREVQGLFSKALRDRHPDTIISVRPDLRTLSFVAFRKDTENNKWFKLDESLPIPQGIMLPNYRPPTSITLPPAIVLPLAITNSETMDSQSVPELSAPPANPQS